MATESAAVKARESGGTANVQDFLRVLAAVHLSSYVESPFRDRGGIFVVGPPGSLKSTSVEFLDNAFSENIVLSDVNVQSLTKMKERIGQGAIRTLILSEFGKIYERHTSVASNIEGTLRALAGEGFHAASYEDATISRLKARVTIVGAMTPSLREKHATRWDETGFSRRFLWSLYSLRDPRKLDRAVVEGRLLEVAIDDVPRLPMAGVIPDTTTKQEREILEGWCKYQPTPHTAQIALLCKTWAVLKWWATHQRKSPNVAWQSLQRFSRSLGKHGVEVVI